MRARPGWHRSNHQPLGGRRRWGTEEESASVISTGTKTTIRLFRTQAGALLAPLSAALETRTTRLTLLPAWCCSWSVASVAAVGLSGMFPTPEEERLLKKTLLKAKVYGTTEEALVDIHVRAGRQHDDEDDGEDTQLSAQVSRRRSDSICEPDGMRLGRGG